MWRTPAAPQGHYGPSAVTCTSQTTPATGAGHDRQPATAAVGSRRGDGRPGGPLAGAGVSASGGRAHYEIRVDGVLDSRWAAWFDGLQVSDDGEETVISGLLADQPALHGLLAKIRDLGLCLISVRRLDTGEAGNEAS